MGAFFISSVCRVVSPLMPPPLPAFLFLPPVRIALFNHTDEPGLLITVFTGLLIKCIVQFVHVFHLFSPRVKSIFAIKNHLHKYKKITRKPERVISLAGGNVKIPVIVIKIAYASGAVSFFTCRAGFCRGQVLLYTEL
ncbi:hypothetical protein [Chimaeribacter arupi]|uniref:hypothetical protein n=1 Tax=Chimaeribacter arupi TaxID=2060066 RepID=UPI0011AED628|nr:hypothetical protein [Chimaeribacter arupi]